MVQGISLPKNARSAVIATFAIAMMLGNVITTITSA